MTEETGGGRHSRYTTMEADPTAAADIHRGWYWIPVVLLTLGIGSILMLLASNLVRDRLIEQDIYLVRAVGQIQTSTAIAHLWVEELVTGDEVDRDEIQVQLDKAEELSEAIIEGGSASGLSAVFHAGEHAALPQRAREARERVIAFAKISERRQRGYDSGEDVGIGSAIDVRYDAVFHELIDDLHYLERVFEARLARSEARARVLFRLIMVAWSVIVAVAAAAIFNRERRRREAEMALRESQAQLLQAQKMEAVGRLAGGIAHDINNHLAAVIAQCELVKMGASADDPVVAKMSAVIGTADKSAALIRRLLAFSRREPVVRETINVNSILAGVSPMLDRLIGDDVRVATQLESDLWSVTIDPSQLEQVLLNLVVNARDAMPLGGRLTLSTRNCEIGGGQTRQGERFAPGQYVCVAVTDSGTGIAPEIRGKIFEPFFTTKERTHGTGLGLATVHGIVKQNNGHIELDSTIRHGTTFRIYFPRSTARALAPAASEAEAASPADRPAHVLLVEDNDELRSSTQEILTMLGYTVSAAACAEDAVDLFETERDKIDLVVTDIIMPGIDGKRMADALRASRPDLRVVFMSGYTDDVILDRGVKTGEVDFVPKPFSAAQLAAKLREVLARAPVNSAA